MKKISLLLLSAAMAFALTACGDAPAVTSVSDNQVETVTPDIEPTVTEVIETSETIETTKEDEAIVKDATNEDEVENDITVDETTTTDTIEDEVVEAPIETPVETTPVETTPVEATPVESTISNETTDPVETQPQTQKAVRVTRTYFDGTSWTTESYYNSYDSIDEALLSLVGLTFNDIKSTWSYKDDIAIMGDGVLNYYYNGEYMIPIRNDRPDSYYTGTETFWFYYN